MILYNDGTLIASESLPAEMKTTIHQEKLRSGKGFSVLTARGPSDIKSRPDCPFPEAAAAERRLRRRVGQKILG